MIEPFALVVIITQVAHHFSQSNFEIQLGLRMCFDRNLEVYYKASFSFLLGLWCDVHLGPIAASMSKVIGAELARCLASFVVDGFNLDRSDWLVQSCTAMLYLCDECREDSGSK